MINKQLSKAIKKIEKEIYDNPKRIRTIVFDGRTFVEGIWKSIQREEEIAAKAELGKRLIVKFDERFAQVRVSDLLAAEVAKK